MASMNKEIKEKWLTALRSGEYEQGKGYLNNHARFCCLGVLTDLAVKNNIGEWQYDTIKWNRFIPYNDSGNLLEDGFTISILSAYITEWADMKNFKMFSTGEFDDISLVTLNDSMNFTFEQIADVIEKNIVGV